MGLSSVVRSGGRDISSCSRIPGVVRRGSRRVYEEVEGHTQLLFELSRLGIDERKSRPRIKEGALSPPL